MITVAKADIGPSEISSVEIRISGTLPEERTVRRTYNADAQRLATALTRSLPSGTLRKLIERLSDEVAPVLDRPAERRPNGVFYRDLNRKERRR